MSKFISVGQHPVQTWHTVAAQNGRSSQGLVMAGHLPPHKKLDIVYSASTYVGCCIKSMMKVVVTFHKSENEPEAHPREEICLRIYKNFKQMRQPRNQAGVKLMNKQICSP